MKLAPASVPDSDRLERDLTQLVNERLLGTEAGIDASSNLYDAGLDSMALMQLLVLLEQEYAVAVCESDLSRDHFSCVRNLARLVRERMQQTAARA